MPSWQSQIIKFTFRNRHLMQGKLKRQVWTENTSIPAFRELCEKGAQRSRMPADIEAVPVKIDGFTRGSGGGMASAHRGSTHPAGAGCCHLLYPWWRVRVRLLFGSPRAGGKIPIGERGADAPV